MLCSVEKITTPQTNTFINSVPHLGICWTCSKKRQHEKLTTQGKVDGKRLRGRSPVRYIVHIKNLSHISMKKL